MAALARTCTFTPSTSGISAKVSAPKRTVAARAGRRMGAVAAAEVVTEKNPLKAKLQSWGFETDEGYFGFTPFAELWVGRAAMVGFGSGVTVELATGHPILEQVGLMQDSVPDSGLFAFLLLALTVPTSVATVKTISDAAFKKMSVAQFRRWVKLFALDTKEPEVVYPSSPWPRKSREEQEMEEMIEYAKGIEMSNGRWAMVGFYTAILIEAATGGGVFQQLIWYARFSGLLGEGAGFGM